MCYGILDGEARVSFEVRLNERRSVTGAALCIGLDPDLALLPHQLPRTVSGVRQFLTQIIEATADLATVYKPNFAFFEALGPDGMALLAGLRALIPTEIPMIADAKRSDIGNTARLYAVAAFDAFHCDAIVVNPYQGFDSAEAYLAWADKGVYILARTSNPGAADFQEILIDGDPLYLRVVRTATHWKRRATLGFVVGATAPEQIERCRAAAPDAEFLIPGIGAQGGDLEAALRTGWRKDGSGVVVNASRSILYASHEANYAEAARAEATHLVQQMQSLRTTRKEPLVR
ncbi:MAG: orotidine-5'-phosphate decarboxylase [Chloroflexi bacterium]|nr:orotidine-5'-phosphate decarboxylase [Chloroflexota bacterium]